MSNFRTQLQEKITAQVIQKLEQGVSPWNCPWIKTGCGGLPVNGKTLQRYNGVNIFILWNEMDKHQWSSNQWLTFKQALEMGGNVRKGEKGVTCVFYKMMVRAEATEVDADGEKFPCMKPFTLFNLDQIEGVEKPVMVTQMPEPGELESQSDAILKPYLLKEGIEIRVGGDQAFYSPLADYIRMPERQRFISVEQYVSTLGHEVYHSTGHFSRLDRFSLEEFDSRHENYAIEELKAAMFEAIFCAMLKIDTELGSHASYIESWLKHLHDDRSLVLKAAAAASRGLDYIETFGACCTTDNMAA